MREVKRTFPNLNVDPDFITSYSAFEKDCNVDIDDFKYIQVSSVEKQGKDLKVSFENNEYELLNIALLNKQTITNITDIPNDNRSSDTVVIPLQDLIEKYEVYYKEKRKVGIVARSKVTGKKCVILLSKEIKTCDTSEKYETPILENYKVVADYYKDNFKKLFNTDNERTKELSELYDMTVTDVKIAILPYYFENALTLSFSSEEDYLEFSYDYGYIKSVKTHRNKCSITATFPIDSSAKITDVILKYRSKVEDISIPVNFKTKLLKDKVLLSIDIEFTEDMPLKPIYWDIRVVVEKYGTKQLIKL